MKTQLTTLFFFLIFSLSFSQVNTTIVRQKTYGGNKIDFFAKAVQTEDGGYLVGAFSYSDVSGDRIVIRKGGVDIWLLKLNQDLTINWQKSIGGNGDDLLVDIISCDDNGFLLLSGSSSPISLDKTFDMYGWLDYWLIKIDSLGNIENQKAYGGNKYNYPTKIIPVNNNFVLSC